MKNHFCVLKLLLVALLLVVPQFGIAGVQGCEGLLSRINFQNLRLDYDQNRSTGQLYESRRFKISLVSQGISRKAFEKMKRNWTGHFLIQGEQVYTLFFLSDFYHQRTGEFEPDRVFFVEAKMTHRNLVLEAISPASSQLQAHYFMKLARELGVPAMTINLSRIPHLSTELRSKLQHVIVEGNIQLKVKYKHHFADLKAVMHNLQHYEIETAYPSGERLNLVLASQDDLTTAFDRIQIVIAFDATGKPYLISMYHLKRDRPVAFSRR